MKFKIQDSTGADIMIKVKSYPNAAWQSRTYSAWVDDLLQRIEQLERKVYALEEKNRRREAS